MPNHPHIKGSTLRTICNQAGIPREDFLRAYEEARQVLALWVGGPAAHGTWKTPTAAYSPARAFLTHATTRSWSSGVRRL